MPDTSEIPRPEVVTELVDISGTALRVSRVALGTWAMGGWMWGGTDERESIATIRGALDQGINLIDTAPAYGSGVSEETVGRAIADAGLRTQAGMQHQQGPGTPPGQGLLNATRERL